MAFFGQNTAVTAVTAQQLVGASNPCPRFLTVTALTGNTQPVFVSTASTAATTTGYPLYAGQSVTFPPAVVTDAASLYVVSAATTMGVAYFGG